MSSTKQETSPAQQRHEIIELAKRHGYDIIAWYIDEGISGDEIEKRPDFRRMLQDGQDGKFDVILCWDQDRFGRFDSLKAGYVIEPLRMRGVRLVTVTQGDIDWNDFAGRMMYAIQQEGKNQFLHSLSQNVLRGRMQKAREGHGVATAPYGYDRVFLDAAGTVVHRVYGGDRFAKPKAWISKLDITERIEEVETVRFIFDRYANTDAGLRQITHELNDRGIRTRIGNEWNYCNISSLLRNPVYTGQLVYGRNPQGRFNHVGNGGIGGDAPIVTPDAHPAIIDLRTFDRVQRKLEQRRHPRARPRNNDYLLSGLLVCGVTGEKMWGRRTAYGNRHRYYTIRRQNNNGGSNLDDCFSIRQDHIEGFILGRIIDLLNQPQLRDRIRTSVTKKLKVRKEKRPDDRPLKQRLADLDAKIERATERLLLVDADALADASRVLAGWRNERRRVAEEVARLHANVNGRPEATVDAVMAELATLKETIHLADPAKLKAALRVTIESITVYWGPGGARKWALKRGVIRFREPLLFALGCTNIHTLSQPSPRNDPVPG